jgi:hypothetical protein
MPLPISSVPCALQSLMRPLLYPPPPPSFSFPDFINVGLQGFVVVMLLYYSKEESQEIWNQGWRS